MILKITEQKLPIVLKRPDGQWHASVFGYFTAQHIPDSPNFIIVARVNGTIMEIYNKVPAGCSDVGIMTLMYDYIRFVADRLGEAVIELARAVDSVAGGHFYAKRVRVTNNGYVWYDRRGFDSLKIKVNFFA